MTQNILKKGDHFLKMGDERGAWNIYQRLYRPELVSFIHGNDLSLLPEAASRLARLEEKHGNAEYAFYYLLQAEYAAGKKQAAGGGSEELSQPEYLRREIDRLQPLAYPETSDTVLLLSASDLYWDYVLYGSPFLLRAQKQENAAYRLSITCEDASLPFFLCVPRARWCGQLSEIVLGGETGSGILLGRERFNGDTLELTFEHQEWDSLYQDGRPVCTLQGSYRFTVPKRKA